jgi:undecaprenyl-diphosphatase
MDSALLHALNGFLAHHDAIEDPVTVYMKAAELLFAGALVAVLLFAGRRHVAGRRAAVAAGLSAGLALLVAQFVARLADRPRPFVSDPGGVHLFARHVADAGFPSDHATAAFAVAVAVTLRDRRWGAAALVAATVLAVGRVGIGVHYPSDVLAGAALGAVAALALWAPPVRARVDGLSDLGSAARDRIVRSMAVRGRSASA